ncbi:hypothetical protein AB0F81_15520 [Actinoplanes sp. NPDC024001]|uniref:hypothetical protein n=1 Tax=Actinoplanes sp. NPDC024001 TaxID=3154598 RepID=UPI0033D1BCDF
MGEGRATRDVAINLLAQAIWVVLVAAGTVIFVFVFDTTDVGEALQESTEIPTWSILVAAVTAILVGLLLFIVTRKASAVKGRSSATSGNLALMRERLKVSKQDRVIRSTRFGSWPAGERLEQRSSFRAELNEAILNEGADVRRIWNVSSASDVSRLREMMKNYQGHQNHSIRLYFDLPYHALPELLLVEGRGASMSFPSTRNPLGLDWMIRFNRKDLVTVVRDYFDVLWDRAERILDAGQPVDGYERRLEAMEAALTSRNSPGGSGPPPNPETPT